MAGIFTAISGLPITVSLLIIYNIVEDASFESMAPPDRDIAEQALLIGWVERNKGIFDLIEVVDRFGPEMRGMKFVICGHGKDWDEFRSELGRRKLGEYFELRGWVDEVGKKQAIAESEICLMLSHHEGMPNALLESMAAGRPSWPPPLGRWPISSRKERMAFFASPATSTKSGFASLICVGVAGSVWNRVRRGASP